MKYVVSLRISLLFFLVMALSSAALAQGRFQPGDRVECDYLKSGRFENGTVVPFESSDLDKSGRWYRVKLDSDKIPGSTVECMATHLRALPRTEQPSGPATPDDPSTTPSATPKNKATKYKPGDRVECDKSQIGIWEKGTVVHFLQNDMDKESGRYYRVRLDSFKASGLYSAGHQCMTNFIRPLAEPPIKPSGRFKVGDTVEAKPWTEGWLPAKVIGIEGAFYKVRFDGRDSSHDEFVADERIRKTGADAGAGAQNAVETPKAPTPKMAGALPLLRGTAWKIDYGKGLTGNVFLFCKSGRWEIVPQRAGLIGAVGRSYSVAGSTLTTVNADDGKVEKWKMSWKGGVLEIFDGKVTLRLHYNGETTC